MDGEGDGGFGICPKISKGMGIITGDPRVYTYTYKHIPTYILS